MNRPTNPAACAPSLGHARARPLTRARALVGALATSALVGAALMMSAGACSLGNIQRADCSSDAQCDSLFPGSRCDQGYCTAGTTADCATISKDGRPCYQCKQPKTVAQFANACTSAACTPFDDKRLTKLTADGGLPPLPLTP